MNSTKRDKQQTLSSNGVNHVMSGGQQRNHYIENGKYNGSHKGTSSNKQPNNNNFNGSVVHRKKEKGVIEKLLNSYGFIECASTGSRVFFHYSEYDGDPNDLVYGDCMEFSLTNDPRNHKLLAVKLVKLPPGSVVMETLSEEAYIGKVEMEPRYPKSNDPPDVNYAGRVSYDKNGEFFFLPFSMNDTDPDQPLRKGDSVSFHIATNKRTSAMRARKVQYIDYKQTEFIQGIVSSLKESFGFIERADIVAEIFFHYSEFNGDVNDLMIGDDVEFQLVNRLGKEIAVKVNKLEPGTVVFEDISPTRFRGHVIKAINTRLLNNSVDSHLTGIIEYQGKTDTHEVLYGDRDTEDDIVLQKGDVVEFNVSTDRRDSLQRSVNIKLISVALKDGQKRDVGVVTALKDGFGFIKCAEHDMSIFFHFSEILEQTQILDHGQEVEFTIENDNISRRQHATRIRFLPKGTVSFENVSVERYLGVVDQEAMNRNMKSPNKQKDQEYGIIICLKDGKEVEVYYNTRDCRPREVPRFCDKVEFVLVTKKANHQLFARDITVLERRQLRLRLRSQLTAAASRAAKAGGTAMVDGQYQSKAETAGAALKREVAAQEARVRFMPKMGFKEWIGLLDVAGVMLDTFPFGAYTSTMEAFSCCGTPTITIPSGQTKMLTAHAVYRAIGVEGLTASTVQEYAEMAVRVASNETLRTELKAQIKKRVKPLFRQEAQVQEWERFLTTAHRQLQSTVS